MAFPVIRFNITDGVAHPSASGAGPDPAITGSKARTTDDGSTRIGFFEDATPNLSQVAVDGSHALAVGTGSGRKLTKITAKKETDEELTGDADGSGPVITAIDPSTAGLSAGDVVLIIGAGPGGGNLYAHVQTVDTSSQITLDRNTSQSASGAVIRCPPQITAQHSLILDEDKAWGIGGKIQSIDDSQLQEDIGIYGWTAEIERGDGTSYSRTSAWVISGLAGQIADGWFTVRGAGAVPPRITTGGSTIDAFQVRAPHVRIEHIEGDNVRDIVRVDSSLAHDLEFRRLIFGDAESIIRFTSAATGSGFRFDECLGNILIEGAVKGLNLTGCWVTLDLSNNCGAQYIHFADCAYNTTGDVGIDVGTCLVPVYLTVERSVFNGLGGSGRGIRFADLIGCRGLRCVSSQFTNGLVGIDLPAGAAAVVGEIDHNNFFGNGTDRNGIQAGPNDTALDPEYRDVFEDKRGGLNTRGRGRGYAIPLDRTRVVFDIGMQREEPAGGSIIARITGVQSLIGEAGTVYEVVFEMVGGAATGSSQSVLVPVSAIPIAGEIHTDAVIHSILAYLRDAQAADLVGKEVLA
jgi:hypothetical protein